MHFLLDTDTCIFAMKGRASVIDQLQAVGPDACMISVITAYELYHGVERCAMPEAELKKVERLLSAVEVRDFSMRSAKLAAKVRAQLERKGQTIGPYDTLIAAQSLELGLTLVTHNTKEFKRVPGLKVEDWLK